MTTSVYFNQAIKQALIQELEGAQKEIYIAVAWFNDEDLFNTLLNKISPEVRIELLISNDPNNFEGEGCLNFGAFVDKGGLLHRLITDNVLMHHKFCVIDDRTVITGSYNWTRGAYHNNLENIVIIKEDTALAQGFKLEFEQLLEKYFTHIKEFQQLLEKVKTRVEELMDKTKKGKLDPNWMIKILNNNKEQFFLEEAAGSTKEEEAQEAIDLDEWWESLDMKWRMFFNDRCLSLGRVRTKPSAEALQHLRSLQTINCANYTYQQPTTNGQTTTRYYLSSISGLEAMTYITELLCQGNNLSNSSVEVLNQLPNLERLAINNNALSALPLTNKLLKLKRLDIENNVLTSFSFLEYMPNLEELDCRGNKFSGTEGLEGAKRLRVLYLDASFYNLPFVTAKLTQLGFEKKPGTNRSLSKWERNID